MTVEGGNIIKHEFTELYRVRNCLQPQLKNKEIKIGLRLLLGSIKLWHLQPRTF